MSRITDYSYLFQQMFGSSGTRKLNSINMSQISSGSVQAQLRAAGIDTNSKQYKAAISAMMKDIRICIEKWKRMTVWQPEIH